MRRLLRIPLNPATVLSLVLCVATAAAWVRSYQVRDVVRWSVNRGLLLDFDTYCGGLQVAALWPEETIPYFSPPGQGWEQRAPRRADGDPAPEATFLNRLGFGLEYYGGVNATLYVSCPYWFITLLTAVLPGARLVAWRRRARRLRMRLGLCQHCGYDCRATPDRCPECGTTAHVLSPPGSV